MSLFIAVIRGKTHKLLTVKFDAKKQEISLYRMVRKYFDILNCLGVAYSVTEEKTD